MQPLKGIKKAVIVVVTGLALGAGAASAAVDYFLKIDGIKGESFDKAHKGEIEVTSWSLGATHAAPTGPGARAAGKPCVSDIHFTKRVDIASPLLLANAVTGMVIPKATLVGRKAGGGQQEYLKIEMKDILVSSVSSGGPSGADPVEQFALSFSLLNLSYSLQDDTGKLGETVQTTIRGGC
jgi:type VI secretion system secreted protein Hcp